MTRMTTETRMATVDTVETVDGSDGGDGDEDGDQSRLWVESSVSPSSSSCLLITFTTYSTKTWYEARRYSPLWTARELIKASS